MDLFEENTQHIQELHGLNRVYAETLITYLRGYWGKDNAAMEETIADLVADMLAAQADGIATKVHFGADPQSAADEILKQLPAAPKTQWVVHLWPLFNALWAVAVAGEAFDKAMGESFDLGMVLEWGLFPLMFLIVGTLFRGLGFNHIQRKNKWRAFLGLALIVGLYAAMFFLPEIPISDQATKWAGVAAVVSLLLANVALHRGLPKLARPWCWFWLVAGALLISLLLVELPLTVVAVALLAIIIASLALEIRQATRLHFLAQARD